MQPRPNAFAEAIEHEAWCYRTPDTGPADPVHLLIADELDRIAQVARFAGATTPAEFAGRRSALEEGRDDDLVTRAYAEGYEAGRRDGRNLAFDEITLVLKRSAGIR